MEFRDLKKQYQVLKKDIDNAVQQVMADSNFISGRQVIELEESLAEYVGVKHCVTCGNGTDALSMMMMAWDIKLGDAVFVPDFTFFSTGEVVSFEGATPVFVDVCKETFNMDPESLEEAIIAVEKEGKLKPRAVIPVDLFGLPYDVDAINAIAHKHNLLVLEDGAQGFGGMYKGRRACSLGDAGTTSFFPAKPLGCYGDGGAIFTNDDATAEYLKSIRVHGKGSMKYDNIRIGWNSRLDTIQAAILQVKFKAFKDYELTDVNKVADYYSSLLKDKIDIPVIPEGYYSSWAQYTIKIKNRDDVQAKLKAEGIPSMVYYPKPMHEQKAFKDLTQYIDLSVTKELCKTVLSLPLDAYKVNNDIAYTCKIILNNKFPTTVTI